MAGDKFNTWSDRLRTTPHSGLLDQVMEGVKEKAAGFLAACPDLFPLPPSDNQ